MENILKVKLYNIYDKAIIEKPNKNYVPNEKFVK